MGSLRARMRRVEREADTELVALQHGDDTTPRWRLGDKEFGECFVHEYERGGRHLRGEDPGPAHPFVKALRTATNLEALTSEHGTILAHWLGEDEILRGLRERPGPPVTWNDGGTVCE